MNMTAHLTKPKLQDQKKDSNDVVEYTIWNYFSNLASAISMTEHSPGTTRNKELTIGTHATTQDKRAREELLQGCN